MARNVERDAREEKRRRNQILSAGFKLFSEMGIENVSLQSIADEADVGIATLYNYYQNKYKLVVAISARMWKEVLEVSLSTIGENVIRESTAYETIENYCNIIIGLYDEKPEILRFSGNYKTYINREDKAKSQVSEHLDELVPVRDIFHQAYEKAKIDNSIRTDLSEQELFTTFAVTMLAMAERYALGIVWADSGENNYKKELVYIKEMLLLWVKNQK